MSEKQGHEMAGGPSKTAVETIVHASCVAVDGRGMLILGASGSGKSGLALALMGFGADLIADDRVVLTMAEQAIVASAPEPLVGLIEARGIGLLKASPAGSTLVACAVDLDRCEKDRMPVDRKITLLGQSVPLLFKVDAPHFPAALMQYLKGGRHRDL
jgi:HPr kinase/phosphorylase